MKILIADDSPENRDLLKYMISQRGHEAIEAADGKAALKKVRSHRPDMVISDAVMPVMDGFQLLRELKTDDDLRLIPFVLVSGLYDSPRERRLAESLGASAFLTKSMKLDEMWGHIESAMNVSPSQPGPEKKSAPSDGEFRESHVQIVVSKLKEKVEQLEKEIEERKAAEQALRASEERFRRLVESTTDYIYTVQGMKGRPASTTHGPGCIAITGYTPEEYAADPDLWLRMIPGEERDTVLVQVSRVLAGERPPAIEHRIIHKNGGIRWVRNTAVPRFDENGDLIAYDGLIADITERKELETTLRRQENVLRLYVEYSPAAIAMFDRDMKYIVVSRRYLADYHLGEQDLAGRSHYEVFPDMPERWKEIHRRCLAGAVEKCAQDPFPRADGRLDWVHWEIRPWHESTGEVGGIILLSEVITEQKLMEMKIRQAASEWALTFDSMADGVSVHSADHTILRVNETLCRILGKSRNELLGKKCYRLFHCTDGPIDDCPLTRALETRGKECHERFEPTIDGGRWVSIAASPVLDEKGEVARVIHVVRDITEQKERERRLQRQLQHVAALHGIDLAITASLDLHVMLGVVLDKVAAELDIAAADILLLNPHLQTLEYASGRGFRTQALRHTHLRVGDCYAGKAALERRIINVPDMAETPGEFVRAKLLADEGFVTYHAAPLVSKGQVKGVLELFHRTAFEADGDWLEFLETLATQAAIAIDNASLLSELQRSNTDLIQAYETTLEGWSRAMDLRDKETEGHCRRVSEMTLRIARAMGVGGAEQAHMYRGALLHDIGKIGVPDSILLKPGRLTDEEREVMKRHTTHAHELLFPIHYLRPAIDIPYCHHEMWDGQGYPRGLKGEDIPLAARIFSVVDVWDALRSDRPYRTAWPEEKVREYIRSLAGIQFDPKIVEIFLAMEW